MEYIKVSKAAEKWGLSPRIARILFAEGKIDGVIRRGKLYIIPENAEKPQDGRSKALTVYRKSSATKQRVAFITIKIRKDKKH